MWTKKQKMLDATFLKADQASDAGNLRLAFRLFLKNAKLGDLSSQGNVGLYYQDGIGTRPDRAKALHWYRKAYRRGSDCAANNMGILWRESGNLEKAKKWFQRAIALGDDGTHLQLAKLYLEGRQKALAVVHLKKVLRSQKVSMDTAEQARRLLRRATKNQKQKKVKA